MKALFITIGTSLFHSASWEPEGPPLRGVRGYSRWLEAPFLTSPKQRETCSAVTETLKVALAKSNPEEWARFLPPTLFVDGPPAPELALRMSAELTTLLRLAARGSKSLRALLAEYDSITIFADSDQTGLPSSWIAAVHLAAYLEAVEKKGRSYVEKVPGLASTDPGTLLGGPGAYNDDVSTATGLHRLVLRIEHLVENATTRPEVDVIATGGFKVYGFAIALLLRRWEDARGHVRILYNHEAAEEVVEMKADRIRIGDKETSFLPAVPQRS